MRRWLQHSAGDFTAWVAVLTAACLCPLWWLRWPAMQDYPQHLFISFVLSTYDDPRYDWAAHYDINSGLDSYSLAYWLTGWVSRWSGIEVAGQWSLSLYVLLMAAVVLRAAQDFNNRHTPWALLLIFPAIFSQVYFLGFQSYLLSIPLLFLALYDHARIASQPLTVSSAVRHAGWLVVLYLAHPYSTLVYIVFAAAASMRFWKDRPRFTRSIAPALVLLVIIVLWYATVPEIGGHTRPNTWGFRWWPFTGTLEFFLLLFTGMRWTNGVDVSVLLTWLFVLGVFAMACVWKRHDYRFSRDILLFLALACAGYFMLPLWAGFYSYFNLRLVSVIYVLLALLLACVPLPRVWGHVCAVGILALIAFSIQSQARIADEIAEISPLFEKMERNAAVMPLMLDTSTGVLDPVFFSELHAHDHYYYHTHVGGGFNPLQFPNPMLPVRLKPDIVIPYLQENGLIMSTEILLRYRYVLVRGISASLLASLRMCANLLAQSGKWTLFETTGTCRAPSDF